MRGKEGKGGGAVHKAADSSKEVSPGCLTVGKPNNLIKKHVLCV